MDGLPLYELFYFFHIGREIDFKLDDDEIVFVGSLDTLNCNRGGCFLFAGIDHVMEGKTTCPNGLLLYGLFYFFIGKKEGYIIIR